MTQNIKSFQVKNQSKTFYIYNKKNLLRHIKKKKFYDISRIFFQEQHCKKSVNSAMKSLGPVIAALSENFV